MRVIGKTYYTLEKARESRSENRFQNLTLTVSL